MKTEPKLRVLTLCQGETPSTQIRLHLPLHRLEAGGAIEVRNEELVSHAPDAIHWADVVIFQRVDSPKGLEIAEEARLYGKPVIYETDDNWVDPPPVYHPAYEHHARLLVRNTVQRLLTKADLVTVSTEMLRQAFRPYNDRIQVIPNTVEALSVPDPVRLEGKVRIGYAGTGTHAGDFQMVVPALNRLRREMKDRIELVFLGTMPEGIQGREGIEEWGFMEDYLAYRNLLARLGIHLAIAPLRDHRFNRYKSNIKYLEYSAAGIVGAYSNCPAYASSVTNGENGLLVADNPEAWYEALVSLIRAPELRECLAFSALRDVQDNYHLDIACRAWQKALSEVGGDKPERQASPSGKAVKGRKKVFYIGAGFLWPHTYIDEFLVRAFSDLGTEVSFHPLAPTAFHEETLALYKNFEPKFREFLLAHSLEPVKLLQAIKREEPDLIFTVQGAMIPRDVLHEISRLPYPTAVWLMDEPYDTPKSIDVGTFFSHVFIQDASSLEYHRTHGNPHTTYLPHGLDSLETHKHEDKGSENWDFSIVGTGFPKRRAYLNALTGEGKGLVVGKKWGADETGKAFAYRDILSLEETAEVYRQSRININIHREETDFSVCSDAFKAASPNASLFYIAGCGGFQLVDDSRSEIGRFFVPDKEIVLFKDAEELRDKTRFYLEHDTERGRIREAGARRAKQEHTYSQRIRKVLDVVQHEEGAGRPRFFEKTWICPFGPPSAEVPPGENVQVLSFEESGDTRIRTLRLPEDAPLAGALNEALLQCSSPHAFISPPEGKGLRKKTRLAEDLFSRNPDLGAVAYVTARSELLLLALSLRILHKVGALSDRYDTLDPILNDFLLRLRAQGFQVHTEMDTGQTLQACRQEDPQKSEKDEERFRQQWGPDPENRIKAKRLLRLSTELKRQGYRDSAHAMVRKALELDPDSGEVHREMGNLLLYGGKAGEARSYLLKAWSKDRENVATGLLVVLCHMVSGEEKEALELLRDLQELEACVLERTSILYNMGRCHRRVGDKEAAARFLQEAIHMDPSYLRAQQELASLYAEEEDFRSALPRLEKLVQLQPKDPEPLNDLGVVLYSLGRKQEAFEVFGRVLKLDRSYGTAQENLSLVAQDLGLQVEGKVRAQEASAG